MKRTPIIVIKDFYSKEIAKSQMSGIANFYRYTGTVKMYLQGSRWYPHFRWYHPFTWITLLGYAVFYVTLGLRDAIQTMFVHKSQQPKWLSDAPPVVKVYDYYVAHINTNEAINIIDDGLCFAMAIEKRYGSGRIQIGQTAKPISGDSFLVETISIVSDGAGGLHDIFIYGPNCVIKKKITDFWPYEHLGW